MRTRCQRLAFGAIVLSAVPLLSQGKGAGSGGGGGGSTTPASASLPGVSYAVSDWSAQLSALPSAENLVVLCYSLKYTNSALQPLVLEPVYQMFYGDPNAKPVPCTNLDAKTALRMDQLLVVAIDARGVDLDQLKLLNITLTTVPGNTINPTPIRPSFGGSTASTNLGERVYYLAWPNRLPGDVIPTVSINLVFTPAVPGEARQNNHVYPAGSIVTDGLVDGHYFVTPNGGISSAQPPRQWETKGTPGTVADGALTWQQIGPTLPQGLQAKPWVPATSYDPGNIIIAPNNLNYYVETAPTGKSSISIPTFPVARMDTTREDASAQPTTRDGATLIWRASRKTNVSCGASGSLPAVWKPNTQYVANDAVCDQTDGAVYEVAKAGTSGPTMPNFQHGITSTYSLEWVDLGTILPATLSIGQQPTDQSVNVLTLQLPQVHSLSYYNLAAGVVYSDVHSRAFVVPAGLTGTNTTNAQLQTSSTPIIDPVLVLTVYPSPVDAESACGRRCLFTTFPGISAGFSLISPSSSFYAGLSFELFRNFQLVVGANFAKETALPSIPVTISNTATTPTTVQKLSKGLYLGATFNVSGFIQTLFSGGGGAGGGSTKSSSGS